MKIKFTYYPIEEAIKAPSNEELFRVYKDRYWKVDKECILFFGKYMSPQCNSNESIMKRDLKFETRFIKKVYIPMKETNDGMIHNPVVNLNKDEE